MYYYLGHVTVSRKQRGHGTKKIPIRKEASFPSIRLHVLYHLIICDGITCVTHHLIWAGRRLEYSGSREVRATSQAASFIFQQQPASWKGSRHRRRSRKVFLRNFLSAYGRSCLQRPLPEDLRQSSRAKLAIFRVKQLRYLWVACLCLAFGGQWVWDIDSYWDLSQSPEISRNP